MKSFRDQTFYELLDVPVGASPEQVEEAFVRAFALYASDSIALYSLVDDHESESLRLKLEEARETLRAPDRRAAYDRALGLPTAPVAVPAPEPEFAPVVGEAVGEAQPEREPPLAPVVPLTARAPVPEPVAPEPAPSASIPTEEAIAAPPDAVAAVASVPQKPRDLRPKVPEVGPETEINGELLRHVRDARGLSLQAVADRTRISRSHIENIEADRYKALPATVYLRGMLVSLAREYKINPEWVTRSYLALAAVAGKG